MQALKNDRIIDPLPGDPKPGKSTHQQQEIVNNEDEIVNSEEQNDLLNGQAGSDAATAETVNKQRGYEEGTRNDSLTEPEFKDSDDQPGFPDEEGQ